MKLALGHVCPNTGFFVYFCFCIWAERLHCHYCGHLEEVKDAR